MSKFLKFIVFTVLTCAIVCTAGLMVPPFFGITTLIMDDPETQTNLPLGSVTYAIPVPTEEITVGSRILVTEDEKLYRYEVSSLDAANKVGTVIDPTVTESEELSVKVQNYVQKVVITIGYVGFLWMLTKSMEGIIILGACVFALVILYIIAEMWRKDPDEEEDEEEDEVYVKSAKELKKEEKEREKRMKEDDRELLKAEKARKKQKKNIIKTNGFVDEILEEDEEPEMPVKKVSEKTKAQAAASEAHEVLKKEIAATTAEAQKETAKEAPKKKAKAEKSEPAEVIKEKKAPEYKKKAIPSYTAAQLSEKAKKAGDKPEVLQDEITQVTLFDYSDIISGEEE